MTPDTQAQKDQGKLILQGGSYMENERVNLGNAKGLGEIGETVYLARRQAAFEKAELIQQGIDCFNVNKSNRSRFQVVLPFEKAADSIAVINADDGRKALILSSQAVLTAFSGSAPVRITKGLGVIKIIAGFNPAYVYYFI